MAQDIIEIGQAGEADLEDIMAIQGENQPEHGGSLSAAFPRYRFVEMMEDAPLVVARRNGRVIGYLVTGTREKNAGIPIVETMLAAYRDTAGAYVYGPICVKAEERRKGLAQAMFSHLRQIAPGRRYVFFIRADNTPSLFAHQKMGMQQVARFVFGGDNYVVFSSPDSEPADTLPGGTIP